VKYRLWEIGGQHVARATQAKRNCGRIPKITGDDLASGGQAKRFSREIATGVKTSGDVFQQVALEGLRKELDTIARESSR